MKLVKWCDASLGPLLSLLLVILIGDTVRGASLVVMATNTTAVPGAKVFTVGVRVTQADVAQALIDDEQPRVPLVVSTLTFSGDGINPRQATGTANKNDLQTIQSAFIDAAFPNPVTGTGANALYRDSWWYSSSSGTLQGITGYDQNSDPVYGTVTTNPTVGALGMLWTPEGPGIVPSSPSASGKTISFVGLYGPIGADYLDQAPLSNQFVNGLLTVPVVQIVASSTLYLDFTTDYGSNGKLLGENFIVVGKTKAVNFLGGDPDTNPYAILDYNNNLIRAIPEPSAAVLAGVAGLLFSALTYSRVARNKQPKQ